MQYRSTGTNERNRFNPASRVPSARKTVYEFLTLPTEESGGFQTARHHASRGPVQARTGSRVAATLAARIQYLPTAASPPQPKLMLETGGVHRASVLAVHCRAACTAFAPTYPARLLALQANVAVTPYLKSGGCSNEFLRGFSVVHATDLCFLCQLKRAVSTKESL